MLQSNNSWRRRCRQNWGEQRLLEEPLDPRRLSPPHPFPASKHAGSSPAFSRISPCHPRYELDADNPTRVHASGASIMENYRPFYLQLGCTHGEEEPAEAQALTVGAIVGKSDQEQHACAEELTGSDVPAQIKDTSNVFLHSFS